MKSPQVSSAETRKRIHEKVVELVSIQELNVESAVKILNIILEIKRLNLFSSTFHRNRLDADIRQICKTFCLNDDGSKKTIAELKKEVAHPRSEAKQRMVLSSIIEFLKLQLLYHLPEQDRKDLGELLKHAPPRPG